MNEMHDKWEKMDHTKEKQQGLGRNPIEEDEEFEWEVLGRGRDVFLSREMKEIHAEALYRKTQSSMDQEVSRVVKH